MAPRNLTYGFTYLDKRSSFIVDFYLVLPTIFQLVVIQLLRETFYPNLKVIVFEFNFV